MNSHLISSTIQLSVCEYFNLHNTNLILVTSVGIHWKLKNSWLTVCKNFTATLRVGVLPNLSIAVLCTYVQNNITAVSVVCTQTNKQMSEINLLIYFTALAYFII